MTGGVEYYKDQVLDYQDLAAKYSDGTVISKAVHLQDSWQLADSVKAVGSLRQDWNSYAGSKLSPALSLEYQPSEKVLYTLAYTEYFAPPKQLQIFSPDYGDEALKPEEGRVYEAGLTYIPDESSSLKINVFHRDATDVIAVDISLPNIFVDMPILRMRKQQDLLFPHRNGFQKSGVLWWLIHRRKWIQNVKIQAL